MKRGYSRAFTPRSNTPARYLLDDIPPTLWQKVRAKARREGVSVRALILSLLRDWLSAEAESPQEPLQPMAGPDKPA